MPTVKNIKDQRLEDRYWVWAQWSHTGELPALVQVRVNASLPGIAADVVQNFKGLILFLKSPDILKAKTHYFDIIFSLKRELFQDMFIDLTRQI